MSLSFGSGSSRLGISYEGITQVTDKQNVVASLKGEVTVDMLTVATALENEDWLAEFSDPADGNQAGYYCLNCGGSVYQGAVHRCVTDVIW